MRVLPGKAGCSNDRSLRNKSVQPAIARAVRTADLGRLPADAVKKRSAARLSGSLRQKNALPSGQSKGREHSRQLDFRRLASVVPAPCVHLSPLPCASDAPVASTAAPACAISGAHPLLVQNTRICMCRYDTSLRPEKFSLDFGPHKDIPQPLTGRFGASKSAWKQKAPPILCNSNQFGKQLSRLQNDLTRRNGRGRSSAWPSCREIPPLASATDFRQPGSGNLRQARFLCLPATGNPLMLVRPAYSAGASFPSHGLTPRQVCGGQSGMAGRTWAVFTSHDPLQALEQQLDARNLMAV